MDSYAIEKVKEAVEKHRGNALRAQQYLLTQVQGDERLLRGLTQPFVAGIAAMAIEKAGGGIGQWTRPAAVSPLTPSSGDRDRSQTDNISKTGGKQHLTRRQLDAVIARLDAEGGVEKTPETVGETLMSDHEVEKTGQTHLSSLQALASAYKK